MYPSLHVSRTRILMKHNALNPLQFHHALNCVMSLRSNYPRHKSLTQSPRVQLKPLGEFASRRRAPKDKRSLRVYLFSRIHGVVFHEQQQNATRQRPHRVFIAAFIGRNKDASLAFSLFIVFVGGPQGNAYTY
jgi:hypothetical protein